MGFAKMCNERVECVLLVEVKAKGGDGLDGGRRREVGSSDRNLKLSVVLK